MHKVPPTSSISCEDDVISTRHATEISIINHDVKTHLSPIKMCAEMLCSNIPGQLNEKQERMIKTMQRCVDKLETLVGDVSDVYKIESHSLHLEKIELDVQTLLDECTNVLRPFIAEKQVELKIESNVHEKIYADQYRMKQILVNLVKNAIDFVPEVDGKIAITVEKTSDSTLLFCVKDNGEGVLPEDFEKIFLKFYKGESKKPRKYGGSGLGLTICKGLVQEHGGKIWLESDQNGSVFKFTVPVFNPA